MICVDVSLRGTPPSTDLPRFIQSPRVRPFMRIQPAAHWLRAAVKTDLEHCKSVLYLLLFYSSIVWFLRVSFVDDVAFVAMSKAWTCLLDPVHTSFLFSFASKAQFLLTGWLSTLCLMVETPGRRDSTCYTEFNIYPQLD